MEKAQHHKDVVFYVAVILLGTAAFSCCMAAEFKKAKADDMKLDGSLCSLARTPAFGLGIAALVFLSVSEIVGTSVAATKLFSRRKKGGLAVTGRRNQVVAVVLLVLSWISYGVAAILLGTGSSMNNRQAYGKGWLDGKCYVVKDGVYAGAAVLAVTTIVFVLGFRHAVRARTRYRTRPEEQRGDMKNPEPIQIVPSEDVPAEKTTEPHQLLR